MECVLYILYVLLPEISFNGEKEGVDVLKSADGKFPSLVNSDEQFPNIFTEGALK